MTDKNKWIFWLFILGVFLIASVPSTFVFESIKEYRSALIGFEPAVPRPIQVRLTPHLEPKKPLPNLDFVSFTTKAPKAKAVQLVGDFNGWKAGTLKLEKDGSSGMWGVLVPLPPGRYSYSFVIDGQEQKARQTRAVP